MVYLPSPKHPHWIIVYHQSICFYVLHTFKSNFYLYLLNLTYIISWLPCFYCLVITLQISGHDQGFCSSFCCRNNYKYCKESIPIIVLSWEVLSILQVSKHQISFLIQRQAPFGGSQHDSRVEL